MTQLSVDSFKVEAEPYPWPYDGEVGARHAAFVVIDMQVDFCGLGGYVDDMGYDISMTRAAIAPNPQSARDCSPGPWIEDIPYARGTSARTG